MGFENFDAEVSEAIENLSHDDEAPLFGDLWPSAKALCLYIENAGTKGLSVLELGCGLALPSILASKLGAKKVIASDYHLDCQAYVEENCRLNSVSGVEFSCLDWRQAESAPKADLIVASDILYEPDIYEDLVTFLWACCHGKSKVVIADPDRVFREDFDQLMELQGFKVQGDWRDGKTKMTIWET